MRENINQAIKKLEDLELFISILIVDDDENLREQLKTQLIQEGYKTVRAVETAEESIKYLSETNILLADYKLDTSSMDGIELVAYAKSIYKDQIQGIVFSGYDTNYENIKERSLQAKASAFFQRPIRPDHIRLWIRELSKRILLQQIIDNLPDEVFIYSEDGTILFNNKEIERIFGKNLVGNKCYEKIEINKEINKTCDDCPGFRAFKNKGPIRTEWDYSTNGDLREHKIHQKHQYVDLSASPFLDINSIPRAIIQISHDITMRKVAENIIDQMELEEAWEKRRKLFLDGFEKFGIRRVRLYLLDERKKQHYSIEQPKFRLIDMRGVYADNIFNDKSSWDFDIEYDSLFKITIDKKMPIIFKRNLDADKFYEQDKIINNLFWIGKNNIKQFEQLKNEMWINFPLNGYNEIIGIVSIDHWNTKKQEYPDSYDLEILEHYCTSAGRLIQNARTRRDIEQRENAGKAILEISKEITNLTKKDDLLKEAVKLTCETMNVKTCSVLIYNKDENKLSATQSYGKNKDGRLIKKFPDEKYQQNHLVTRKMFEIEKPFYVNDFNLLFKQTKKENDSEIIFEQYFIKEYEKKLGEKLYNCIYAPLMVGNERIGLLRAINKKNPNDFGDFDFDENDLEVFNLIAGQIAIAIFNANLQKERDQVFLNIAHSLVSPITSIKGLTELIVDNVTTDMGQIKKDLFSIAEAAEHLASLAEQVLNLTRLQNKTIVVRKENIYLNELVSSVINMNKYVLMEKGIKIKENLNSQNPEIYVDKNLMKVALQGIVDNAIKFTNNNQFIEISSYSDQQYVYLIVKDYGIGIHKDDLNKIFLKNYRGKYALTSGITGSGIGLTVSKEILSMHGGYISVESKQDYGSIFTIKIPITMKS